jgi:hypothetical protein
MKKMLFLGIFAPLIMAISNSFWGVRVAKPLEDTSISDKKINWLIDCYDCPPSEPKNLSSFLNP